MQQFDRSLSQVIDSTLGVRCKFYGYQYSEILRSLMCIYFCGGSYVEDLSSHLINHLSLHPKLRTCSADTILRAISELAQSNISYASDAGKKYAFNTAERLNELMLNCLMATLADAIMDRLVANANKIELKGESMRQRKKK